MRISLPRPISIAFSALLATSSCVTTPARLAVASTTPQRGSSIGPDTDLQIEVAYAVDRFMPGQDGVAVLFKTRGGGTWEASRQVITSAAGRVNFQIAGADLFTKANLVRPYQLRFVLDSREGPAQTRLIKETAVIFFEKGQVQAEPSDDGDKNATPVPPSVGKGQLLSDMANDRRYRPQLPA